MINLHFFLIPTCSFIIKNILDESPVNKFIDYFVLYRTSNRFGNKDKKIIFFLVQIDFFYNSSSDTCHYNISVQFSIF